MAKSVYKKYAQGNAHVDYNQFPYCENQKTNFKKDASSELEETQLNPSIRENASKKDEKIIQSLSF